MITKWLVSIAMIAAPACIPVLRADAPATEQAPGAPAAAPQETAGLMTKELAVTVGKSLIVDSPVNIQRVSVANGDLAEAVAITPKEVLVNGKAPGETTLIIWQQGGNRLFYDLTVRQSTTKIDAVRSELAHQLSGQDITVNWENDTAFVGGTVKDLNSAERAVAIAGTLGKVVNLLHVAIPPVEAQILLKVRFANVERSASLKLGLNINANGALNTIGYIHNIADTPNILLTRKDINLGVEIEALQSKNLLEILAEPNVLAINGKMASFVSGGEFPYPTLQGGGAGLGAVTIQFREFGIRLQFLPQVTPRGTIRLQVTPEVSSLDFAHGLVFQGFSIPALATRRISTEIELESGQSFAIAGLLDNTLTESMTKIPGLGNIPLLGKIFQSKTWDKQNTELLILVTPELVRPVPQGQPVPELPFPKDPAIKESSKTAPRTPGMDVTGPVPVKSEQDSMPVESLQELKKSGQPVTPPMPAIQFIPVPVSPAPAQSGGQGLTPSAGAPTSSAPGTTGK